MICVLLGCLLAAAAPNSGYRIAGIVLNAVTRQPVSGARVTIAPVARQEERLAFVTSTDGRFVFAGMPAGKYELIGEHRGFITAGYHQHGALSAAIAAGPGQDTANLVLQLAPSGAISGRVTDDAGEPVEQAGVELLASAIVNGRRRLMPFASKPTDDTGEFRFASLPPGPYYLAVSGFPWYSKLNQMFGDARTRGVTHMGYAVKYYPNTNDPAAAEPLVLQPAQELSANFTLLAVPAVAIHVHTEGGENLIKEFTLTAAGLAGKPVIVRQGTESGDLYNFWGIPAGHYTLHVHGADAGGALDGLADVDAAAADMEVTVTLAGAPSLTGSVDPPGAGLSVTLTDTAGGRTQTLPVAADGKFSVAGLSPGRYDVALSGPPDYYLKRWSVEGARREGDQLDLRPGGAARLQLLAAQGSGRLSGAVTRDGHPVPAALVVLAPGHAVETDTAGAYEFRGLPPGDYSLFALAGGAELEYANPAAIQPYLASAQEIHITAARAEVRDIALSHEGQ